MHNDLFLYVLKKYYICKRKLNKNKMDVQRAMIEIQSVLGEKKNQDLTPAEQMKLINSVLNQVSNESYRKGLKEGVKQCQIKIIDLANLINQ